MGTNTVFNQNNAEGKLHLPDNFNCLILIEELDL